MCTSNKDIVCSLKDIEEAYFALQRGLAAALAEIPQNITKKAFKEASHQKGIQTFLSSLNLTYLRRSIPSYEHQDRALLIAIGQLQETIKVKLKDKGHHGELVDVGSTVDQTKVNLLDEVDMLFVVSTDQGYIIQPTDKPHVYRVTKSTSKGHEIQPRKLRQSFAQDVSDILSSVALPKGLVQSGCCCPRFSGIRYNGPATTALMTWESGGDRREISMDITLVLKLPVTDERRVQQEILHKCEKLHGERPHDIFRVNGIHLFPNPMSNQWELSTAHYEAILLGKLPRETPFKMSIQLSKAIASQIAAIPLHDLVLTGTRNESPPRERGTIEALLKSPQDQTLDYMKYGHAFLTPEIGRQFKEMTKKAISINTAAIKHIALQAAGKVDGAFTVARGTDAQTDEITSRLMADIFGYISTAESHVEHFFLGSRISFLSIATWASQMYNIPCMVSMMKAQCLQISHLLSHGSLGLEDDIDEDTFLLQQCTVPISKLQYAENTYSVPAHFCGEACNTTFRKILKLIYALGNTMGGIIQVNDDSSGEVTSHGKKLWQSAFKIFCTYHEVLGCIRFLGDVEPNQLLINVRAFPEKRTLTTYRYTEQPTEPLDHSANSISSYERHIIAFRELFFITEHRDLQKKTVDYVPVTGQAHAQNHARSLERVEQKEQTHIGMLDNSTNLKSQDHASVVETVVPVHDNPPTVARRKHEVPRDTMNTLLKDLKMLSWTARTDNWEDHLIPASNDLQVNIRELVTNEDTFLKMSNPMNYVPSKEFILRLCGNHKSLQNMLQNMEESVGDLEAFTLVTKDLSKKFEQSEHLVPPNKHMLDLLTIDKRCRVQLASVMKCSTREDEQGSGWDYLMNLALILRQLLTGTDLTVHVRCSLCVLPDDLISSSVLTQEEVNPSEVLTKLAAAFLQKKSYYKDRVGLDVGVYLTAKQMNTVLTSGPINFIEGPPGSGKTYIAFHVCSLHKPSKVNYICFTAAFKAYLDFQMKCISKLIHDENEFKMYIAECYFGNFECVIIDDVHQLRCSYKTWQAFFLKMKESSCDVFILADSTYQNFMLNDLKALKDCITAMSDIGENPFRRLNDIHRNTRKVVSFLVSCAKDQDADARRKLPCSSQVDGDDIEVRHIDNALQMSSANKLLELVRSLLSTNDTIEDQPEYEAKDITILVDTTNSVNDVAQLLGVFSQFSDIPVHRACVFPVVGLTIDALDNFMGFDRQVCICVTKQSRVPFLCDRRRSIQNPRYRAFVASRGVSRVIFVTDSQLSDKITGPMKMNKLLQEAEHLWTVDVYQDVNDICWLATGHTAFLLYSVRSKLKLSSLAGKQISLDTDSVTSEWLRGVASSDDGKTVIAVSRHEPYSWRVYQKQTSECYSQEATHLLGKMPCSVQWTSIPEEGVIFVMVKGIELSLEKYSPADGTLLWRRPVDSALRGSLTTDRLGRLYVTGGSVICVYSATGDPERIITKPDDVSAISSACVDSTSRWIFTGHVDGTVSLFHEEKFFRQLIRTKGRYVLNMCLYNDKYLGILTARNLHLYNVEGVLL